MYLMCSWKRVFRFGWFGPRMKVCRFTGQTVDPTFVVGWDVVAGGWFCELCYRVAAFVTDFDVCVSK